MLDVFIVKIRKGHRLRCGGVGKGIAPVIAPAYQYIVAGTAGMIPQNAGFGTLQITIPQSRDLHTEPVHPPADVTDTGPHNAPQEHMVMEKLPYLRLRNRLGKISGGVIHRHEAAPLFGHRAAAIGNIGHQMLAGQVAVRIAAACGNIHRRTSSAFLSIIPPFSRKGKAERCLFPGNMLG